MVPGLNSHGTCNSVLLLIQNYQIWQKSINSPKIVDWNVIIKTQLREYIQAAAAGMKLYFWKRGLPDRPLWTRLQEVLGIRLLHVWRAEIPPNLLVADFASGLQGSAGWSGWPAAALLLCRGQIAPGGPGEEGGLCCGLSGHSWSAPSSAHFLALLSVCLCVCVCIWFVYQGEPVLAQMVTLVREVVDCSTMLLLLQFICICVLL